MMIQLSLQKTVDRLVSEFDSIPPARKDLLRTLSDFIKNCGDEGKPANLIFICTHNSRRSMMAQLWAQAAAYHYGIPAVYCYSGGTEATAFNPRAVTAMQEIGFDIASNGSQTNPHYAVRYADDAPSVETFSKTYDDPFNPQENFAAIMTCSDADQNCPLVIGARARIRLTYNDPKEFDGTDQEAAKYHERAVEIGREMLFAFSLTRST